MELLRQNEKGQLKHPSLRHSEYQLIFRFSMTFSTIRASAQRGKIHVEE
jgi:hypothetical protein